MVAAQDDIKLSVHCDIQFYSMFSQTQVFQLLERAEQRDTLRRMMAAWVARCVKSGNIPQYPLMVALQYDLKESTLKLGREMLAAANNRRGTSTSTLPYLMLAVGKFGDKQDVELLEPLIDNKTVCHTWHTGKHPEPIKIEVRDVALAVLVHLTGQEHKDYGFELLQRYDRTLFSVHTCGYVENEKREAAMAKWRQWSKSRPAE
jgi:hypothetical protein